MNNPLYGPDFSSYTSEDVTWLLTDLSDVQLEQPVAHREYSLQNGGHYSETLPIEYQPSEEYLTMYQTSLVDSSKKLAQSVATLAGAIYDVRGENAVIVSLARAGTPIGILLKRYAKFYWGYDWAHYTISIIRDKGIDVEALKFISERHSPNNVIFVDGWTGKGAISKQLIHSLDNNELRGFSSELAVLSDPAECASFSGTREDFLIASACLNSTVSGLVSRTVYRPDLTGTHGFHGAKFYKHLKPYDRSNDFLTTICEYFSQVEPEEKIQSTPTWKGWNIIMDLTKNLGVTDINLVKPGVGETTRVLLRRVPWKVLIDPRRKNSEDLDHIRILAQDRGVCLEEYPGLPYLCVGIIRSV